MRIVALLICGLVVTMAANRADAGERTFGDGTLPHFLEIYDLDGDGVLSEEERQAMREARSSRAQEMAEKMAVKLLLPMCLFIFPAVVIVMAGPAAVVLMKIMSVR